jgi:hypothetical protein
VTVAEGSSTYDFAVLTHATIELGAVSRLSAELTNELGAGAVREIEAYGRSGPGEIVLLFRFSFQHYSAQLRRRMGAEAEKLKGRCIELNLLPEQERARFLSRLAGFDVQPVKGLTLDEALASLRERMGLGTSIAGAPVLHLPFDSDDDLLSMYARYVTEGALFIPTGKKLASGAEVRLLFVVPGSDPLEAGARILEPAERGQPGAGGLCATGSP